LSSHDLEQEPGNRPRRHEGGVGGGGDRHGPDGAGVQGMLPGGAGRIALIRVGTEGSG
jgi:hypothetical protein